MSIKTIWHEWTGWGASPDPDEKARKATRKAMDELNRRADQQRLGYRFADDNPFLFIHGKGVWTGVIMPTYNDDFTSPAQQEAGCDRRSRIYRDLLDFMEASKENHDSVICHELMRHQPVDASGWEDEYLQKCWDPSALFRDLVREHVRPQLEHTSPDARRFLLIRLGDFTGRTSVDPLTMVLGAADHVVEEHFERRDLDRFRQLAMELHEYLGIEPMNRADLAWLIRKIFAGHFDPPFEHDVVATRPWRGGYFDQVVDVSGVNLSHSVEVDNPRMVEGQTDKSYIATLVVADSEPLLPFRYDAAWGKILRTLDYPVGISWRYMLMTGEKWAKTARKRIDSIMDEAGDRALAGKTEDELFAVTYDEALHIKRQNELAPEPAMVGQIRFTVAAPSLRQLESAVTQLKSAIKDMTLAQPKRIQYALLREQLPGDPDETQIGRINMARGTSRGIDVGTRWTSIDALAVPRLESVPNVGDGTHFTNGGERLGWHGHLIGYSRVTGAAVHFDPHVQMERHGGAGVGIIGASGGGKSSLALTLFFWMSEAGTQCVAIDPKNDFEAFCYYLAFGQQVLDPRFEEERNAGTLGTDSSAFKPVNQEFWDETDIIDLFRGPRGMLGAWQITDTYEKGESLAWAQLELLIPADRDRDLLASCMREIRETHEKAQLEGTDYTPSLLDLTQRLNARRESLTALGEDSTLTVSDRLTVQERLDRLDSLVQRLDNAASAEYSRLLFSDPGAGADTGFRAVRKRRTVITLFGFQPPESRDPSRWGQRDRHAAAAMFTALHAVNEFFVNTGNVVNPTTRLRERRKRALFIDEAYVITALPDGRDLLSRALRQGRALRFAVIIISQQAADIQAIEDNRSDENEADQNQFASVFVFQQRGLPEARAALALLREYAGDTEARDMLAKRILPVGAGGELSSGVCVMRDFDGRVAVMHVDPLFEELYAAEQTEPGLRAVEQQRPVPARGVDWHRNTVVRDAVRRASQEADRFATDDDAGPTFDFGEYTEMFSASGAR